MPAREEMLIRALQKHFGWEDWQIPEQEGTPLQGLHPVRQEKDHHIPSSLAT